MFWGSPVERQGFIFDQKQLKLVSNTKRNQDPS